MSAATGLLTAVALMNSSPATAEDGLHVTVRDEVLPPNSVSFTEVNFTGATAVRSQVVVAFATQPLDGTGDGAGWPASFKLSPTECEEVPGYKAVFTCLLWPNQSRGPEFVVSTDAPEMTTLYRGYAYIPPGGDLAEGIEAARSAGARPATATSGMSRSVVMSREHALRNTVAYDLPDVPAGKTVRQALRIHANDAGRLYLNFLRADGQVSRPREDIQIGNVTTGPGSSCTLNSPKVDAGVLNLNCRLEPGDHTITYELTAAPGVHAWRMRALTSYNIYTSNGFDDTYVRQTGTFSTVGAPVLPRHDLLARDTSGQLFWYNNTGTAATPFSPRAPFTTGWQTYNKITRLSPVVEKLIYSTGVVPAGAERGRGDIVARDSAGYLWYYDRQFAHGYATRVKVGSGWNIYNQLAGAGDVNRDSRMDLVARDASGVLWLYKGTGSTSSARFATRVKIGSGWGIYNQLAAGADLNDDGKPDLVARDASGVLWLYKGTGSATAPYATRVKVGTGWKIYNQLSLAGDLTNDGKTDAVARDTSGVLWLYKGTGSATAPFAKRSKIGGGWNIYNTIL